MAQEGADWTADVLDRLDHVIEVVRSNTTDRLLRIARLLVFGLIAGVVGLMALVLLIIAAIRLLDVVLPRGVWLPDVVLGAIFLGFGLFLWSKRTAPRQRSGEA